MFQETPKPMSLFCPVSQHEIKPWRFANAWPVGQERKSLFHKNSEHSKFRTVELSSTALLRSLLPVKGIADVRLIIITKDFSLFLNLTFFNFPAGNTLSSMQCITVVYENHWYLSAHVFALGYNTRRMFLRQKYIPFETRHDITWHPQVEACDASWVVHLGLHASVIGNKENKRSQTKVVYLLKCRCLCCTHGNIAHFGSWE